MGTANATGTPCSPGQYCMEGLNYSCPAGTFNSISGGSSLLSCALCPVNTFSRLVGSGTNSCAPCTPPEGANLGAAACWPGVLGVIASSSDPVVDGLSLSACCQFLANIKVMMLYRVRAMSGCSWSADDMVTVYFSKATNVPAVPTFAMLSKLVSFSPWLSTEMFGLVRAPPLRAPFLHVLNLL